MIIKHKLNTVNIFRTTDGSKDFANLAKTIPFLKLSSNNTIGSISSAIQASIHLVKYNRCLD